MNDFVSTETSLLSAAWRYKLLVAGVTAVAVTLGIVFLELFPPQRLYSAQTTMVVQSSGAGLDVGASGNPQRFVANQIEILRSGAVAQLASEIAAQSDPPVLIEPEDFLEFTLIRGNNNSDLIGVVFTAADPIVAVTGANALASAYQQLASLETTAATVAAIERIDVQLDTLDRRLQSLDEQITETLLADNVRTDLRIQYEDALAEIAELQVEARTASGEALQAIQGRLDDFRVQITTYQDVLQVGQENDELDALLLEEDLVVGRRSTLLERRDQIAIDLDLAPEVVAFLSPAQTAEVTGGSGPGRVLAVALLLGLLGGVAVAYLLASRRRIFHHRLEPQAILHAPLLADIPDFAEEGLKTRLPVRDSPRSAAAEAFRFATASLELKLASQEAKLLAVLSATLGTGKSTVVANLALAASREGNRVLVIDADFGNQDLTSLLTGEVGALTDGLTDVIDAGLPFVKAIRSVDVGGGLALSLLSRGRQPVVAADLLRSPKVKQLFDTVREEFDLVLVDAPPLLQVAYASTLASYVEGAVVIVGHRDPTGMVEETSNRLNLIGASVFGYLYNRSPLRREMTVSEGSMVDILGDLGAVPPEADNKRRAARWGG